MIIVVMGVSGSGKSTVGSLLADELDWPFYDADDFHNEANRNKMSQGIPLTDDDRSTWLASLRELIQNNINSETSIVLACSALKESYRAILKVHERVRFVYLKGSYAEIESRLKNRTGHFMPVKLLKSQFETLEEPRDALTVALTHSPEEIIQIIYKGLAL
ncbi:MAG: gluconokinase [Lewinellaceae bacterium]|nr:gluconokinase [Lewinellaceae bacterium]